MSGGTSKGSHGSVRRLDRQHHDSLGTTVSHRTEGLQCEGLQLSLWQVPLQDILLGPPNMCMFHDNMLTDSYGQKWTRHELPSPGVVLLALRATTTLLLQLPLTDTLQSNHILDPV